MNTLIKNILTSPVYDVAKITPLDKFTQLSHKLNHRIYLKREDFQPVFSFKCRGAYHKIARLQHKGKIKNGVITASAGNHAQGVALAANKLKIKAVIVMPNITPEIKINAVKRLGGDWTEIVIQGDNFDASAEHAKKLEAEKKLVFVHPFDDMDVIAGQGTVGKEIIEQLGNVNAIFVPIGGGGLAAGIGAYIKSIAPEVKVIGVEHVESASMKAAVEANQIVSLEHVGVFADGVAVKQAGELTFSIIQESVDEFLTVSTDQVCAAINLIFDETRHVVEPSGAIALAGIKKWCEKNPEQKHLNLVGILSGANMNFDRLRHVTERTAIGRQAECLLGISIPEKPNAFKYLCDIFKQYPITEFNYRYRGNTQDKANVFVGLSIKNKEKEVAQILERLNQADYDVNDFTDNNIAKLHLRYMTGGVCKDKKEALYRIEFPERPGALFHFLHEIDGYNITLFHYRNHGSDYGRVLIGIEQADEKEKKQLNQVLSDIGYHYVDETNNKAFQQFLR